MIELLVAAQVWIHRAVSDHLDAFASSGDWGAFLAVAPLGVVFGAVHALTPGHSKTILASYLVGSRLAWARGVAVSTVLAATHVLTAVLIALLAAGLLSRTIVGAGRAPEVELISRGLVIAVGVWFLIRALRGGSHRHPKQEGLLVGIIGGLIPCPLTLFVMVLALARGVPEAGLVFAAAMMVGIGLTLGAVATAAVLGRDLAAAALARFGASAVAVGRGLDGLAGVLLIAFGALELPTTGR